MNEASLESVLAIAQAYFRNEKWVYTEDVGQPELIEGLIVTGLDSIAYDTIEMVGWEDSVLETTLRENRLRRFMFASARDQAIRAIADVLEEKGIHMALIRGAALAQTVYREPLHRAMSDVDILVSSAQMELLREALQGMSVDDLMRFRCQYSCSYRGVKFEFHERLLTPKRFRDVWASSDLLARCERISVPYGGTVAVLPALWELYGVLAHAVMHHEMDRVVFLLDVAFLSKNIDLAELIELAERDGLRDVVRYGLWITKHLMAIDDEEMSIGRPPFLVRKRKTLRPYEIRMRHDDDLRSYVRRKWNTMAMMPSLAWKGQVLARFMGKGMVGMREIVRQRHAR